MARKYYMVRTHYDVDHYAQNGLVAIGWSDFVFGDYVDDIDALVETLKRDCYGPDAGGRVVGRGCGQVRRYMAIAPGDIILVPCYRGFYMGEATGEHRHDPAATARDLANQRVVRFKLDKDGKPMFFKREGKSTALASKLGTPGFVILGIEDDALCREIDELWAFGADYSRSDLVLLRERQEMEGFRAQLAATLQNYAATSLKAHGEGFEDLIAALFECDGFEARRLSKRVGRDAADADILAVQTSSLGPEFGTAFFIQAKHHMGLTGAWGYTQIARFRDDIQSDLAYEFSLRNGERLSLPAATIRYVLITSARFDERTEQLAQADDVILVDGARLAEMIYEKIDRLDDYRYQLGFYRQYAHITPGGA